MEIDKDNQKIVYIIRSPSLSSFLFDSLPRRLLKNFVQLEDSGLSTRIIHYALPPFRARGMFTLGSAREVVVQ